MKTTFQFSPLLAAGLCVFCFLDRGGLFWPFVLGVLLHEGGHLLALRLLHVSVRRFSLGLGGAVIETGPCSPAQEALVAAAGPMMNGLLLALGLLVNIRLYYVNLILLCYNLLPVLPLDGGRLLSLPLCAALGEERGERAVRLVGFLTVLLAVGFGVWAAFAARRGFAPLLFSAVFLLRLPNPLQNHP